MKDRRTLKLAKHEPETPRSQTEFAIESALVPLRSFKDILCACEDRETAIPPGAVGCVLEVLLREFEQNVRGS